MATRGVHRNRSARSGVAAVALLLAAEAAAVAALVQVGSAPPFDLGTDVAAWARATPEDALAAALRWVALASAAWLLVVTALDIVLAVASGGRSRRSWGPRFRVAPPAIRRLVDRAVVTGVAAGVVLVPGTAHAARSGRDASPPAVVVVRDGRGDLASLPPGQRPVRPPRGTGVSASRPVPAAPAPTAPTSAILPDRVVAGPGDSLWEIAAQAVALVRGVPRPSLPDADVAAYWVEVCDANRDRLASGDVDVLFAGETVLLPPLS
jgi:hypothetical protein